MFSWDTAKALKNYQKHGVSFEEASTVFGDSFGLDWQDLDHSEIEPRSKRIGFSSERRALVIVYTLRRLDNAKETIRIISARPANRKEREAYTRQRDRLL